MQSSKAYNSREDTFQRNISQASISYQMHLVSTIMHDVKYHDPNCDPWGGLLWTPSLQKSCNCLEIAFPVCGILPLGHIATFFIYLKCIYEVMWYLTSYNSYFIVLSLIIIFNATLVEIKKTHTVLEFLVMVICLFVKPSTVPTCMCSTLWTIV